MSRIGRMPVVIPEGVDVKIKGSSVRVKGPKGEMQHTFPADISIAKKGGEIKVQRPSDAKHHRALHGMTRALINNMVMGVSSGFEKVL
ncbi:MAG: 50S ribosomal protein L6, partial [Anaerolineales bacterium]